MIDLMILNYRKNLAVHHAYIPVYFKPEQLQDTVQKSKATFNH